MGRQIRTYDWKRIREGGGRNFRSSFSNFAEGFSRRRGRERTLPGWAGKWKPP